MYNLIFKGRIVRNNWLLELKELKQMFGLVVSNVGPVIIIVNSANWQINSIIDLFLCCVLGYSFKSLSFLFSGLFLPRWTRNVPEIVYENMYRLCDCHQAIKNRWSFKCSDLSDVSQAALCMNVCVPNVFVWLSDTQLS